MKIFHFLLLNLAEMRGFYFPEYFIIVDFFPNLFNKAGKTQTGVQV